MRVGCGAALILNTLVTVFALTTSQSIELGVAAGTALLALATFVLAWQAWAQARATTRLAETTERDFLARTVPVVRLMREERPDQADIVTVNKGDESERLVVRIENRGQAPAGIERLSMSPGGIGELAGMVEMPAAPVLEPSMEWDVDFTPSEDEKRKHQQGHEVLIQVVYEAIGSGIRYRVRTRVRRDVAAKHERWVILGEEPPSRLGP
jgi:hypothetical protein